MNVLGLGELVSILDRRAALLRDSPESDPARSALQGLVEWSYDLLHGDEKTLLHKLAVHRGGASLASLVAIAGTAGLNEATVTYLVGALVDKSIVSVSFPDGVARYDLLDSVREYVLGELERSGRLETVRGAHAEHFAALAADAAVELRGPEWRPWETRLEPENDNLWAALAYARDGSDSSVAARLGMLGWYFALAERISEGRSFLDLAVSLTGEDAPAELRIEQLSVLGYLAIEERDLEGALLIGERALALATSAGPRELGLAQLTYALALAETGQEEQADRLSRDAIEKLEAAGDHWGAAAAAVTRATTAATAGDVDTVDAMTDTIRRHADAIDYDAFREPGLLLEAWVAERRGDQAAAVEGYRCALELGRRIGFRDHEAFALCGLGSNALGRGDLSEASESLHEALALAQAADAAWVVAHARAELARVAAASGHADEAADLYRDVLAWARAQRPHQARENLARALAGDPAAAAELGLAELGQTALT